MYRTGQNEKRYTKCVLCTGQDKKGTPSVYRLGPKKGYTKCVLCTGWGIKRTRSVFCVQVGAIKVCRVCSMYRAEQKMYSEFVLCSGWGKKSIFSVFCVQAKA